MRSNYDIDFFCYITFESYGDTMTDLETIEQRIADGKSTKPLNSTESKWEQVSKKPKRSG